MDLSIDDVATAKPLIEDGELTGIVVLSEERLPGLPDVPCSVEKGIDANHRRMARAFGQEGDGPRGHKDPGRSYRKGHGGSGLEGVCGDGDAGPETGLCQF